MIARGPSVVPFRRRFDRVLPAEPSETTPKGAVSIEISGGVTWVDPQDVALVSQWRWKLQKIRPTWPSYAVRSKPVRTASGHLVTRLHRLIMDAPPGIEVDHRDRDGLNNTRQNLRLASSLQNKANTVRRNKSGYRGVAWCARDRRFTASISSQNRSIHLGSFACSEDAARAYDLAALDLHGEFAVLNFPAGAAA